MDTGSTVRILRQGDKARVRNHFANSMLVQGVVESITGEVAQVRVRENSGRQVVVRTPDGSQLSLPGHELRRCPTWEAANLVDPYGGADMNRANRKLLNKVCVRVYVYV